MRARPFAAPGNDAACVRILVIEDDPKTANAIVSGLRNEGYDTTVARTGDEGLAVLANAVFQLVVLDWMLPGRDGLDVLRTTRARGIPARVLLLTAKDAVEDRVLGLDSGADDYLVKPFAFAELLARIRVLLRRSGDAEPMRKHLGDLTLDVEHRRVMRGGEEIILTPREFDLLAYLLRHHQQAVTRRMLATEVWREPNRVTPLDNVIDVHIAHLRRKLDEGRAVKLLHTIRGVGFTLREENPA
jgi:two-component system copper resistance phosphate regulon response regulator CusR